VTPTFSVEEVHLLAMNRPGRTLRLICSLLVTALFAQGTASSAFACTAFTFKAQDGSAIYGRTMEWGASDLKSEMVFVPRGLNFSAALDGGKVGATWQNRYGFVGINAEGLPYAADGMNEAGLTVGALFFPGFAEYQQPAAEQQSKTVGIVDLVNYL
jgi:choloylglycine hydrolase